MIVGIYKITFTFATENDECEDARFAAAKPLYSV